MTEDKTKPVESILWCPHCQKLHIDEGEWTTRVHHTHLCEHCGKTWNPRLKYPTVGVACPVDHDKDKDNPYYMVKLEEFNGEHHCFCCGLAIHPDGTVVHGPDSPRSISVAYVKKLKASGL